MLNKKPLIYAAVVVFVILFVVVGGLLLAQASLYEVSSVKVTNVTDTGATITWFSNQSVASEVYVKKSDEGGWVALPFISKLSADGFYDDRDVDQNEDGDYVLKDEGKKDRYSHHVTLRNLEPETEYSFKIGTKYTLMGQDKEGKDLETFKTGPVLDDLKTPDVAYGRIEPAVEGEKLDGIVYFNLIDAKDGATSKTSATGSTVISELNNYTFDIANVRSSFGEGFYTQGDDTKLQITFNVKNYGEASILNMLNEYKPIDKVKLEKIPLTSQISNFAQIASAIDLDDAPPADTGSPVADTGLADGMICVTESQCGSNLCDWCGDAVPRRCAGVTLNGTQACAKNNSSTATTEGEDRIVDESVQAAVAEAAQTGASKVDAEIYDPRQKTLQLQEGIRNSSGCIYNGRSLVLGEEFCEGYESYKVIGLDPATDGNNDVYYECKVQRNPQGDSLCQVPLDDNECYFDSIDFIKNVGETFIIDVDTLNKDDTEGVVHITSKNSSGYCIYDKKPIADINEETNTCYAYFWSPPSFMNNNCLFCNNENYVQTMVSVSEERLCGGTYFMAEGKKVRCEGEYQGLGGPERCLTQEISLNYSLPSKLITSSQAASDRLTANASGNYVIYEGDDFEAPLGEVAVNLDGADKAEIRLFVDANGNGKKDKDEVLLEDYSQISLKKDAEVAKYGLNVGWNLIAIPLLSNEGIATASELLDHFNNQGANIKHIAKYTDAGFVMYTKREGDIEFSNDFNIVPGQGYFILNYTAKEVKLKGNKFDEAVPFRVQNGWNLVGVYTNEKPYTAEELIKDMTAEGIVSDTVSRFDSGLYTSVVYEDDLLYGNDYNLFERQGYFIRVKEGGGAEVKFTPKPEE